MENKDLNGTLLSKDPERVSIPPADALHVPPELNDLSLEPSGEQPLISQEQQPSKVSRFLRLVRRLDVLLAVLLLIVGGLVLFGVFRKNASLQNEVTSTEASRFGTIQLPLSELIDGRDLSLSGAANVTINGTMQLNSSLLLTPSLQPTGAKAGQLYYDQGTNQLAYFNGEVFVYLNSQTPASGVQSLGGVDGELTLGDGLEMTNNQLNNAGVLSVQGQTGAVIFAAGAGIVINGTTFSNDGVISVASGSPNVIIGNDGNGNVTISVASGSGSGSGTVTSSGGTAGVIPIYTADQNIEDSIITQSGLTVTISGDLSVVTGGLSLSNALTVSNGGTGATSFANNGVLVGQGTGAFGSIAAGGAGLCLISTAGAPVWGACPGGGGVTTLNGLSGALSIANSSGAGSVITIDDASTTSKGIASFNATNFTVTNGAVNLVQNINTSASPTFTGVNTNNINPDDTLTVGFTSETLVLQGGSATTLSAHNGASSTSVIFQSPAATAVYRFVSTSGTYDICTTAGNCAGIGGGVSTPGGSINRLAKFGGAQSIEDSSITDDGSTVTTSANLVVQGGGITVGVPSSQTGGIGFAHVGSAFVGTITQGALTANRTYTLPNASGTICLSSGNCSGSGSSNTLQAAYDAGNTIATSDARNIQFTLADTATDANFNVVIADGSAGSVAFSRANGSGSADPSQILLVENLDTDRAVATGIRLQAAAGGLTVALDASDPEIIAALSVGGNNIVGTTASIDLTNFDVDGGTGNVSAAGNMNLSSGGQYQINGAQISSSALSNDANLAKLDASQTFTGNSIGFRNASNSTNAFSVQNAAGNRILTVDSSTAQLVLGASSALDGRLVFANVSNANSVMILPGMPTANRTLTLPDASGILCTDSGNCAGAGATLQTAYTFSIGGTTPKIKVNNSLGGVDIQDADTPIGANLLNIRASNGAGLGSVLFGVGNTGAVTLQNSANSTDAFRLLTAGGTAVLVGDTTNGQVLLGQSNTLNGTLVFRNSSNANTVTLTSASVTADRSIVLPNASGTICLSSGNCSGSGSSNTLQAAYDAGNTIATSDARNIQFTLADTATDANFTVNLQCDVGCGSNGRFAVQDDGVDVFSVAPAGGAAILRNVSNSTLAFQVQNASGVSVLSVDTANRRLGINNTAPSADIDVGPITLAASQTVRIQVGDLALQSVQGDANAILGQTSRGSNGNLILDAANGSSLYASPYTTNFNYLAAGGGRVRIGSFVIPSYTLDVAGHANISSGSAYKIGGTDICTISGCTPIAGSSSYIQNQNSLSQTANFRITGTGWADTLLQAPAIDTPTGVALAIGQTNATGIMLYQNTTVASGRTVTIQGNVAINMNANSTTALNLKNAASGNVFTVDSSNGRVGINLGGSNVPTLQAAGLEIAGALRLSGGAAQADSYTTPGGAAVSTMINIVNYTPAASGQVLALGVPAGADSTVRVVSLYDARTTAHQPTLAVFSPNESTVGGFSYDGSNTDLYIKNSGSKIVLNVNGNDRLNVIDGGAGINVTPVNQALAVTTSNVAHVGLSLTGMTGQTGDMLRIDVTGVGRLLTIEDDGTTTFRNFGNSSGAFRVLNASSLPLFTVDASSTRVHIGSTDTDTTGALLVLDTKFEYADPTGVNGGMYYNLTYRRMRCYFDNQWRFCNDPVGLLWGPNVQEEFIGTTGDNYGELGWGTATTGTGCGSGGTIAPVAPDVANRPGQLELRTGTSSTTGCAAIYTDYLAPSGTEPITIFGGEEIEFAVKVPTLADATNDYRLRLGLCDTDAGTTDCIDGLYFVYDRSVSATNWALRGAVNNARSTDVTNYTVNTGWNRFKISVSPDCATSCTATFSINGVIVGTIANSSIPKSNSTQPMFIIGKKAGTSSRALGIDYFQYRNSLTSPR